MVKKILEIQGEDINLEELEDEVYVRNDKGEFVKLEVSDDAEDN